MSLVSRAEAASQLVWRISQSARRGILAERPGRVGFQRNPSPTNGWEADFSGQEREQEGSAFDKWEHEGRLATGKILASNFSSALCFGKLDRFEVT